MPGRKAGIARVGYGKESPNFLASLSVLRFDEARIAALAAGAARDHFAIGHNGTRGVLRLGFVGFPAYFSGASVERHDISIDGSEIHHVVVNRQRLGSLYSTE